MYPGSFDPVTNGHLDIAARASKLVDTLVIAVYKSPAKNLLFSIEDRVRLWQDSIEERSLTNVRVEPFEGLIVDFVRAVGGQAIIRGLRATTDFEVEFQQALMNHKMAPEIEVLCMITDLQYLFLSSSMLKEVARLKGDYQSLVPKCVAEALERRYS